jgi:hypothetical protein
LLVAAVDRPKHVELIEIIDAIIFVASSWLFIKLYGILYFEGLSL